MILCALWEDVYELYHHYTISYLSCKGPVLIQIPCSLLLKVTHAAEWSYGSKTFKLNEWLKYNPRV